MGTVSRDKQGIEPGICQETGGPEEVFGVQTTSQTAQGVGCQGERGMEVESGEEGVLEQTESGCG